MEPAAAVVPACSRAGLFPSTAQTRGCPLAHSTSFLPISGPQNRILSSGFPALLLTEAVPAFLLFLHACFFFHTRTPPDQSSAMQRGDAGLRGPGGRAVCPQPPPAAVKPHCASEAERNQNRGSACGIHRRLLGGAVSWFTAVLHSAQSKEAAPAACAEESPDSPAAGLGL